MAVMTYGTDTGYPAVIDEDTKAVTFRCVAHQVDPSACALCAATEREGFLGKHTTHYPAYVNSRGTLVTTFGGFELGVIIRYRTGRRRCTPTGGYYRLEYVTVRDAHGGIWHGAHNSDGGNLVLLRKSRKAAR
jgi:hypothetical protein